MNYLLIIDMLPTYGLLFYLLVSVCVFVEFHGLCRRSSGRAQLRLPMVMALIASAASAVFASLVYVMAAPLAQQDMVDFYVSYQAVSLGGLVVLFLLQAVYAIVVLNRTARANDTVR